MKEEIESNKKKNYEHRLKEIYKRNGHLTAEIVLNDAKNPQSPIHDWFNWDDTEAAKLYRLEQARNLIRSIKIIVTTTTGEELPVRAYYNIVNEQEDEDLEPTKPRIYVSLNEIEKDADKRAQVVQYAWNEIQYWNQRYKIYKEFTQITNAIERTKLNA